MWPVEFHPACEQWADPLDQDDAEALLAAIRVLRDQGPTLGRPLVDTVKGSRHSNMKELRPGFDRTDRDQSPVRLRPGTGGHPARRRRQERRLDRLYETNIPIADDRFDEHQAQLAAKRSETSTGKSAKDAKSRRRKKR